MKHLLFDKLLRIFPALAAVAALTGCDSTIYDGEGDCDPVHIIRFNYDMNMKFVDAFPAEVPSVDLHVFDTDGRLVTTVSRHVTPDEARNFQIELRGLAPGHYNLLAWCGVKESEHFKVNPDAQPEPEIHHHTCRIHREDPDQTIGEADGGHIRNDIGRLYHGRLDNVDMTQDEGHHVHTVDLTKDTNVIRVVLQHLSGAPMDKDDYVITITDANGHYDHDNFLLPDQNLTYHPWRIDSGTASFHPEDDPDRQPDQAPSRVQSSVSAIVSELTVGRLMANRSQDAMLTVRNKKGALILSVPLIETLLLVKGYYYTPDGHRPLGDQEYLDRQDEYPLTFFLDQNNEWIRTVIYINSWRIVRNNSTLH